MVSDTSYTWSRKWVTKTIPIPCFFSIRMISNSFCTSSVDKLDVGSSKISTFAEISTARAMATICCTATE